MRSNYKKLGRYIRQVDERNSDNVLGEDNLYGLSVSKEFISTHANLVGVSFDSYKVVAPKQFAYIPDTSRRGDKIAISLNSFGNKIIVSSICSVFEIIDENELLPEYLMLWFKRPEFDRYARFMSNGSAREVFDWDAMCSVELPVPPISEQRKIVHDYQVITDRIKILKNLNKTLTNLCCINYQALLGGLTEESEIEELPTGWSIGSIGSYCDLKSGYAFKSEWWTDQGCKVIKIANIEDNSIDLDSCSCVSEEHGDLAKLFLSVPGDIFIAMTGATTGKFGILPYCKDKVFVNQRVGKFFLGKEPLKRAPFLFATLLSPRVARRLQPDGMAGSAQDNLSPDDIKNVSIVIPDDQTLSDFNSQNYSIIENIIINQSEIRLLNNFSDLQLSMLI